MSEVPPEGKTWVTIEINDPDYAFPTFNYNPVIKVETSPKPKDPVVQAFKDAEFTALNASLGFREDQLPQNSHAGVALALFELTRALRIQAEKEAKS